MGKVFKCEFKNIIIIFYPGVNLTVVGRYILRGEIGVTGGIGINVGVGKELK